MGLTVGVEACLPNESHTRLDLLRREGVSASEEMLILTCSVDEEALSVDEESRRSPLTHPFYISYSVRRRQLVGGFPGAFHHRHEVVEIGVGRAPACHIGYG